MSLNCVHCENITLTKPQIIEALNRAVSDLENDYETVEIFIESSGIVFDFINNEYYIMKD